ASGSVRSAAAAVPTLGLAAGAAPGSICALNTTTCEAGTAESRVQLSVNAPVGLLSWPAVEVAFVIETTAFDGVYDPVLEKLPPGGRDPCALANPNGPVCEESNGVPFFEDNLGGIVGQIQTANPHTSVSFAMIDYQGTCDMWDDGCWEHPLFHVDVSQFRDQSSFVTEATQSFKDGVLNGGYVQRAQDLADPFLHGSSITSLYGAMGGGVLHWTPNTHHVIVWMGSTAPRDPSYVQNYCVSSSSWLDLYGGYQPTCQAATCEPSYSFPTGASPQCEGWVRSQDGIDSHSIAALARTAPDCVDSVGGSCTVDIIDLPSTPTDPLSQGWPTGNGQGPGSFAVQTNAANILLAGCDLATATGGAWYGPSYFSCPDGQAGSLQYVPHGSITAPQTANPTLMSTFKAISFGPEVSSVVAVGTDRPMFSFVPVGHIALAWDPQFATACRTPSGFSPHCPIVPTESRNLDAISYGWNWSTNRSQNQLSVGDTWTVSFNVVSTGPPYRTVPVDACATSQCIALGSGLVDGWFTAATYTVPGKDGIVVQSFPIALVTVSLASAPTPIPPAPTPGPPFAPPALPVPVSGSLPTPVLLLAPIQSPIGSLSVQPLAAGLLAAAFTRVMVRHRAVAMAQAVLLGRPSGFHGSAPPGPEIGRME
ncbi:MAG TPA: hypothetical protein VIZ68_07140, partial [Thermoplasmata archaeon]